MKMQAAAASVVSVAIFVSSALGNGIRPVGRNKEPESIPVRNVISDWKLTVHGEPAVVAWSCDAFVGQMRGNVRADATMRLRLVDDHGRIRARVFRSHDSTELTSGDEQAVVTAGAKGSGAARFRLNLALPDRAAAAGNYRTTVRATITSN